MRYGISGLALVVGLALLAGCASTLSEQDLQKKLRTAGTSVKGLGKNFVVVPVYADSRVAAWTLIAEAKSDGSSVLGRRLSHDFKRGAQQRRGVVVGGPYSKLTRAVVLDAFEVLEGRSLQGLTLVYVGDAGPAKALRSAAKAHRVRFYQRDLN